MLLIKDKDQINSIEDEFWPGSKFISALSNVFCETIYGPYNF